jgi:hypothetical protein
MGNADFIPFFRKLDEKMVPSSNGSMFPSLLFCRVHFRLSNKQIADPGFGEKLERIRSA